MRHPGGVGQPSFDQEATRGESQSLGQGGNHSLRRKSFQPVDLYRLT